MQVGDKTEFVKFLPLELSNFGCKSIMTLDIIEVFFFFLKFVSCLHSVLLKRGSWSFAGRILILEYVIKMIYLETYIKNVLKTLICG